MREILWPCKAAPPAQYLQLTCHATALACIRGQFFFFPFLFCRSSRLTLQENGCTVQFSLTPFVPIDSRVTIEIILAYFSCIHQLQLHQLPPPPLDDSEGECERGQEGIKDVASHCWTGSRCSASLPGQRRRSKTEGRVQQRENAGACRTMTTQTDSLHLRCAFFPQTVFIRRHTQGVLLSFLPSRKLTDTRLNIEHAHKKSTSMTELQGETRGL